jgi:hypothetical protein
MKIIALSIFISCSISSLGYAIMPISLPIEGVWARNTLATLTLEQKIGQLLMIEIPLALPPEQTETVEQTINAYQVGGIFLSGPACLQDQINLVNRLQAISPLPLLVGQDLEWIAALRLRARQSHDSVPNSISEDTAVAPFELCTPIAHPDIETFWQSDRLIVWAKDVSAVFDTIKKALQENNISVAILNQRVFTVLLAKEWLNLHENRFVRTLT